MERGDVLGKLNLELDSQLDCTGAHGRVLALWE